MFDNMIKSGQYLFAKVFNKKQPVDTTIDNSVDSKIESTIESSLEPVKGKDLLEKIYFQPNTIYANESVNCSVKHNVLSEDIMQRIILECNQNTMLQLDKICRYFEIEQNTAIMRGLWMLSVVKEVELSNKKLGIITLDESNVVVDISPINLV